jgi:hypothetical protein
LAGVSRRIPHHVTPESNGSTRGELFWFPEHGILTRPVLLEGRHHSPVGYPFHFHFWLSPASQIAPHLDSLSGICHELSSFCVMTARTHERPCFRKTQTIRECPQCEQRLRHGYTPMLMPLPTCYMSSVYSVMICRSTIQDE